MTNPHSELQALLRQDELLEGRYRIGRRVGAGAYGMIFRAVDEESGKTVAIKAIPQSASQTSATAIGRFRREMKVIRNLSHPNIISLYDWGRTESGTIFMVLEFIEGKTLDNVVRDRPMETASALNTVRQLALALEAAHDEGVIHRDLKPANVMLEDLGETAPVRYRVKVLDFGMAKVLSPSPDDSFVDLTQEGMAVGTPRYIAPEQARGLQVGPPADLYAVGLLMYEIFTGIQAVQADTVQDAVAAHVSKAPLDLEAIDMVPPIVRPVLIKLVEKKPARRFQSARALVSTLDELPRRLKSFAPDNSNADIGRPLGDVTGDFPGAGGGQSVLDLELRTESQESEQLGSNEQKLELDYGGFQTDEVGFRTKRKRYVPTKQGPPSGARPGRIEQWFRLPRSGFQWAEATLSVVLVPLTFILVGAQAAEFDYGLRVLTGLSAPLIALVWALSRRTTEWSETFGRRGWICCVLAIVVAHLMGPEDLAIELMRNPGWFVQPFADLPGMSVVENIATFISRQWAHLLQLVVS